MGMPYYDRESQISTKERMFDYLEELLVNEDYGKALTVFKDLKANILSPSIEITLDDNWNTPRKLKYLLSNSKFYTTNGGYVDMYKNILHPDAQAVFHNLDVTHNDLIEHLNRITPTQHHQQAALYSHPNLDQEWLINELETAAQAYGRPRDTLKLITLNTPHSNVIKRAFELLMDDPKWAERHDSFRRYYFGDGSSMSNELLEEAVTRNIYTVYGDPRISQETLENILAVAIEKQSPYNFYSASFEYIISNPNVTEDILRQVFVATVGERGFRKDGTYNRTLINLLAKNPNTPFNILEEMSISPSREIRMLLAQNRNTPVRILRKLSDSKLEQIRESAIATLRDLGHVL